MRALVLAAGLGKRLRPLTDSTPKPLVKVNGRPMITYVLDLLGAQGFSEALVNIHHFPEQMRAFVADWNASGRAPSLTVQDESARILGSGGALALAGPWLFAGGKNALVCNADVIASPDFREMSEFHARTGAEASLAVMEHPGAGTKYTGLRMMGDRITAFERPGVHDPGLFHFPGFYLIKRQAIARLPAPGTECSIVEAMWLPQCREGLLYGWKYAGDYLDLGTVPDLEAAERLFREKAR